MATLPKLTPAQTALVRRLVRYIRDGIKRGAYSRSHLHERRFGYGAGTDYPSPTIAALAARGLVTTHADSHARPAKAGYGRKFNERTVWTLNLFFRLTPLFLELYDEGEAKKTAPAQKNPATLPKLTPHQIDALCYIADNSHGGRYSVDVQRGEVGERTAHALEKLGLVTCEGHVGSRTSRIGGFTGKGDYQKKAFVEARARLTPLGKAVAASL